MTTTEQPAQHTARSVTVEVISGWTDFNRNGEPITLEGTYKVKASGFHHARLPILLEAAPELLEACKAAYQIWLDDPRTPNGGIADRLRAAITKATQPQAVTGRGE